MQIILLVLTSAVLSALFICFFALGYYLGTKKEEGSVFKLDERNANTLREMAEWSAFKG